MTPLAVLVLKIQGKNFQCKENSYLIYSSLCLCFAVLNICNGVNCRVSTLITGHYRHLLLRSINDIQFLVFWAKAHDPLKTGLRPTFGSRPTS